MSKNLEPVELDRSECARDGFLWQNDDPQCHALIQHKQTLFAIHGNTLKSSPIKFRGFSTTHAVGECKIDDSKEECPGRRFLRYSCVCAWPAVTLCTTSTSWRRRSFGNSAWARQQTHHLRLRAFEQQWIRPQPRWETKSLGDKELLEFPPPSSILDSVHVCKLLVITDFHIRVTFFRRCLHPRSDNIVSSYQ